MATKHEAEGREENEAISPPNKREKSNGCNETTTKGNSHESYVRNSVQCSQFYEHRGNWIAYFHWGFGSYYYVNTKTSVTQWEPPDNWDRLPPVYNPWSQNYSMNPNTDEIGADSADNEVVDTKDSFKLTTSEIAAKLAKYVERPARRQVEPDEKKKVHWMPEGATEYNIWYDRWVGEHWHKGIGEGLDESETRCCLETDAGFTKANILDQGTTKHYYCFYFAKGCCHLGSECGFLHSIPTDKDEERISLVQDCFGRNRHQTHKENMGGVGTFNKESRTLYVGRLSLHRSLEENMWTEFGEWGEIEDIRIIPKLHIAFVRYKNRVNAEFAKVAMADQRLGNKDLLNVRWAYDDPNPKAHKEDLIKAKENLIQSITEQGLLQELESQPKALTSDGPIGMYPETSHQYPSTESTEQRDQTEGPNTDHQHGPIGVYPNTHHQYPSIEPYRTGQGDQTSTPVAECGPMSREHFDKIQALENAHEDCTRLDEALKRIEAIHETGQNSTSVNVDGSFVPTSLSSGGNRPTSTDDTLCYRLGIWGTILG